MQVLNQQVTLNSTEQKKWYINLLGFLRPVAVLYIGAAISLIGLNSGVVKLEYFIPNEFVQGGIILYFLNAGLDYFNKLK